MDFRKLKKEYLWIGGSVLVLALLLSFVEVYNEGSSYGFGGNVTSSSTGLDLAMDGDMMDDAVFMEKGIAPSMTIAVFDSARIGYSGGNSSFMPPTPEPTAGESAAEVDQRIIKNGSLSLVVDSVQSAVQQITAMASTYKGFVQHSSVSERRDGRFSGNITIRVPSADFENVVNAVKGLANVVENESMSGQDVTEQYTDLEARLRNAEAQEETYLSILDKAKSVEDILKVQQQLGNIRSQIESYKGRIKYLENQTSLSTLNISLSEEVTVHAPTKAFRPGAAVSGALQSVVQIVQGLVIWLIWFMIIVAGVLAPLLLVLWLFVWGVKKLIMRKYGGGRRRR